MALSAERGEARVRGSVVPTSGSAAVPGRRHPCSLNRQTPTMAAIGYTWPACIREKQAGLGCLRDTRSGQRL